jgi:hypothetical protein
MNMRKIIALLLVLVMVCGVVPFAAMAEGETANAADFNTIVTSNANGDSSYTKTFTTANGWETANSAIQTGGPEGCINPQFAVIGPDNTHKAVCMNGKVSAPGSIKSPTLTGGISKLTVNYTKMFTDTKLSATVTLTDLATGTTYTHTIAREEEKNTKYVVWTDEWVLDTPITGDFTIQMVNDCPSGATGNKDRMTILGITWEAPAAEKPAEPITATYTFADYKVEGELGGGEATRELDENVTFTISSGWFTTEARIYKNANAVIAAKQPMSEIVLNAGYKDSTFNVYTSADGENWTMYQEGVAYVKGYGDVKVTFAEPVKYIKIDAPNAQVRIKALTVTMVGGSSAPEVPETPAEPKSATIDFSTADQRVSQDDNSQVWTNDGLTLTNGIGTSTQPIKDYTNPVRLYAKTTLKIEFAGMTKLEAVTPTTGYANALKDSIEAVITGATVTYVADGSNQLVTITFAEPVDSIEFPMVAQTRFRTLTAYSGEVTTPEVPEQPEQPEQPEEPKVPETLAEQIAEAGKLANKEYLPYESTITGTITDDPQESSYTPGTYKFTVSDGTNTLLCYYTPVTGGVPAKGDAVTVTGKLTAYNGTAQFDSTASAVVTKNTTPEVPEQPEQPEVPETPTFGLIEAPVAGTAYKFGMIQGKVSATDVYYLTGAMKGYYMDTITDNTAAIDVYLEETTGGYHLYALIDGTKTYINMVVSADGAHVNGAYEAAASTVYTYSAEKKTVIAVVDGEEYWFGTRNDKTYTTVGPVKVSYDGFYCQFYGTIATEEPEQPENPETPEQPEPPQTGDFALIAIGTLMAMSVAAVCLLKKKEF